MGDGPRGQSADRVHTDGRGGGRGGVHRRRNWGGWGGCEWDLDSRRHVHGAGHPEALLLVGLKHVGEAEPLAAHVTRVGLLACVSPTVPLHVGAAGEAFATDFTDKGFLSSVCFHVLVEVLLHVEVLAAPLAHELFVPDVDAHVGTELVLVLKPFVTVLTSEGLLSRVLQGVHLE